MCTYKGKEYASDTGRIIRKFDIYICDLGEPENNNLGKKRPCVIIQSNKINHPKQITYLVAPIRTEHSMEVTRETLQHIVDIRRNVGRIYIPIEISPNNFSFIDMTRMRCVQHSDIYTYKHSIINPELKKKINSTIYELLLEDDDDLDIDYSKDEDIIEDDDIDDYDYEEDIIDEQEDDGNEPVDPVILKENLEPVKAEQLVEFSELERFYIMYQRVVTNKINMPDAARELNVELHELIAAIEWYEKDEAARFDKWRFENSDSAKPRKRLGTPSEFIRLYVQWEASMVTYDDFKDQLGLSYSTVARRIADYKKYKAQNAK